MNQSKPIVLDNLLDDLNSKTDNLKKEIARKSITVVRKKNNELFQNGQRIAYVGLGATQPNGFAQRVKNDLGADTYFLSYKDSTTAGELFGNIQKGKYDKIIVSVSDYSLRPANNYNISNSALQLWQKLETLPAQVHTYVFGNVLAIKNFCEADNLVAGYQDDDITHQAAADILEGKALSKGTLPVSICQFKFGDGIVQPDIKPVKAGISKEKLQTIDSIVNDAIVQKAFPGAVVFAAHKGQIIYHKAFGHYDYGNTTAMTPESIFDLASVTKISATTVSVMKLYEQGKLDLKKKLGDYLPWVRGSNKENLEVGDILLHQAGLVPFIPFYRETIDSISGSPNPTIYSDKQKPGYTVRVAEKLYIRDDWEDTMFSRILASPLGKKDRYVYSDNDFIFLGEIIEQISGMTLDQYASKTFYQPMGMLSTGFKPRARFPLDVIVPTEEEKHFRKQLTRGDVHDEGASMFGGVAGHAGLFSNSYDLAMLYQMLLNGGEFNGVRYLKQETIDLFTSYHGVSRRGYGFDKPEKDNKIRKEPYPSEFASPQTFGHTGFTGTCVWVDPKYDLVYIFLSNRVYPTRDNPRLSSLGVRGKVQDAIYRALGI